MRKLFLLIATTFMCNNLIAQTVYKEIDGPNGEKRQLKIQVPRNYEKNVDTMYPVIIVLDGDYLFEPVAGIADYYSYWDEMPDVIVVGINQSKTKDADFALAYNNKASLLLDENKFEKAKIEIEKALEADAEYAPAYNNKGVINHKIKKYKEAIVAFDKAIQIDVDYAKAYLNRGISKQMIRDEDGACLDWKKANELGIMLAKKYLINDCE